MVLMQEIERLRKGQIQPPESAKSQGKDYISLNSNFRGQFLTNQTEPQQVKGHMTEQPYSNNIVPQNVFTQPLQALAEQISEKQSETDNEQEQSTQNHQSVSHNNTNISKQPSYIIQGPPLSPGQTYFQTAMNGRRYTAVDYSDANITTGGYQDTSLLGHTNPMMSVSNNSRIIASQQLSPINHDNNVICPTPTSNS